MIAGLSCSGCSCLSHGRVEAFFYRGSVELFGILWLDKVYSQRTFVGNDHALDSTKAS